MGQSTGISWTDHTFNPWWGCAKVSEGCKYCYAETLADRFSPFAGLLAPMNSNGKLRLWGQDSGRRTFGEKHWKEPLRWNLAAIKAKEHRRVFSGSMCDVFEDREDLIEPRKRLWRLIRATPNLEWQLLTKRPENILDMLPTDWEDVCAFGYPNVWLGVSIESQRHADRASVLCDVPAMERFVSYEPAIGPLRLDFKVLGGITWVIFGGESGQRHRDCDLDWARSMQADCRAAGVAFFFKQDSGQRPGTLPPLIDVEGEWDRRFP